MTRYAVSNAGLIAVAAFNPFALPTNAVFILCTIGLLFLSWHQNRRAHRLLKQEVSAAITRTENEVIEQMDAAIMAKVQKALNRHLREATDR